MIVAVKALVQLVFYGVVIAVAVLLFSQMVHGGEQVRLTLSGDVDVAGQLIDTTDPERLWFQSRGEVTTLLHPIRRDEAAQTVPVIAAKPQPVNVDEVVRNFRVRTIAERVRKAFLDESKPAESGTQPN